MFVKIENGVVVERKTRLGGGQRDLAAGNWVTPHAGVWSDEDALRCGWHRVAETEVPDHDDEVEVAVSSVELVDGLPVLVWDVVPGDAAMVERKARRVKRVELRGSAAIARAANHAGPPLNDAQLRDAVRDIAAWVAAQDEGF